MKNELSIENLTNEIRDLKQSITELTAQVEKLQLRSDSKLPGVFKVGDKVTLLTSGLVGRYGDKAVVTKVGRRISVVVNGRHTNRVPTNLKHDEY